MLNDEFRLKRKFEAKMLDVLEYQKQYREKNREKAREYSRKYYRENIEKVKKQARKSYKTYRQKNLEHAKEYRKKYPDKIKKSRHKYWLKKGKIQNEKRRIERIENPEKYDKINEKRRYDRKKNPEKYRELGRQWYQKNSEKVIANNKKMQKELT